MRSVPEIKLTSKNKGRSEDLLRLRNEALIKRFFYWFEVKGLRYDRVLSQLSTKEFFISESRIEAILTENRPLLDNLYKKESIN